MLVFAVYALGLLLEGGMQALPQLWRARKGIASVCVVLIAFSSGAIVLWQPNVFSVLIGMVGLYRVFNCIRIVEGRIQERHLRYASRRTSVVLVALQATLALYWLLWHTYPPDGATVWIGIASVQVMVALMLLTSTIRRLRRTAWPHTAVHMSDEELPTITVAIPARNETADLQACLESLIVCDYPKLEILVLDDCSQTKRTPEIIRGYAHAGVRFIKGDEPHDMWLAKNQAYARLADEASGEYIVFAGVDIRFSASSLRQLATLLLAKKKQMMSVLPYRSESVRQKNAITQAMRYFWELVPPRRLFNRPPVLSSCWIIRKQALAQAGGFEAVTRAIVPEAHFARRLITADGYSFMRASARTGIESVKSLADQRETAVRTRYPQLHRRPENVVAAAFVSVFCLFLPFVLVVVGFWLGMGAIAWALALFSAVLLTAVFYCVAKTTRTTKIWFGLIGMPLGALYDLGLLHYSMWQYEFSTVEWKGRNICIPAMHVVPRLPDITS